MLREMLKKYDFLVNETLNMSVTEIVKAFRVLHNERLVNEKKECEEFAKDMYRQSVIKAREYASQMTIDEEFDFFAKIESIRRETSKEMSEKFLGDINFIRTMLDNKEKQLLLILMEKLAKFEICLGRIQDAEVEKRILWLPIGIDVLNNRLTIMSKEAIASSEFEKKGYTCVEDEDDFGCAEVACGWKDSDIRKYMNSNFFNDIFSNCEKKLIMETMRHPNQNDFLISNDMCNDYIFLLTLDEYLMLKSSDKFCAKKNGCDSWWLCEQKSRGWDDTGEMPRIYCVKCESDELTSSEPQNLALLRPCVALNLDDFLLTEDNEISTLVS